MHVNKSKYTTQSVKTPYDRNLSRLRNKIETENRKNYIKRISHAQIERTRSTSSVRARFQFPFAHVTRQSEKFSTDTFEINIFRQVEYVPRNVPSDLLKN